MTSRRSRSNSFRTSNNNNNNNRTFCYHYFQFVFLWVYKREAWNRIIADETFERNRPASVDFISIGNLHRLTFNYFWLASRQIDYRNLTLPLAALSFLGYVYRKLVTFHSFVRSQRWNNQCYFFPLAILFCNHSQFQRNSTYNFEAVFTIEFVTPKNYLNIYKFCEFIQSENSYHLSKLNLKLSLLN